MKLWHEKMGHINSNNCTNFLEYVTFVSLYFQSLWIFVMSELWGNNTPPCDGMCENGPHMTYAVHLTHAIIGRLKNVLWGKIMVRWFKRGI